MIGALVRRCSLAVCVIASCLWIPTFATIVPTYNNLTSTTTTTKKPSSPTPATTRLALVQDSSETQTDQQHQVAILKQINRVNDDGSYTFGYEAADGSFKIETRDVLGNVKGMFGFVDENGQLKRVSYSANNATGFRQSGSLSPTPVQTTSMQSILVTGQHVRNENEEFTPQIRTVETSTVAGPVLRKVLITKRIRPNSSARQDGPSSQDHKNPKGSEDSPENQDGPEVEESQNGDLENIHQTEHTGLLGNALRRQLQFGPLVPISIRPDDTSDVYGPTTASPGRRLPSRIPSIPPRQIQNILEPTPSHSPLYPPVPPGSYPIGGLDPRLRRPPSRDGSQNAQGYLTQRSSQSPPLPLRLSPLMRILLRMISEEAAALEPYFSPLYGPRPHDDYRSRPYNDPYHSRMRRPYDIYPRQRHYEDYAPRIRPQENLAICGRPDEHLCGMQMYEDGPFSQHLPIAPPPQPHSPRYDVYENVDPNEFYRKQQQQQQQQQRPLPVPPPNAYINPYATNNPDPNEINENQLLKRLFAARGRVSPSQNSPPLHPQQNTTPVPQNQNSSPQSPSPPNPLFQNPSSSNTLYQNPSSPNSLYQNPSPHPSFQNPYSQPQFQNLHPQPQFQNPQAQHQFQNSHPQPQFQNPHPQPQFQNPHPHPQFQNPHPHPQFQNPYPHPQFQNPPHPHFHNHPPFQNPPHIHFHNPPPHSSFQNPPPIHPQFQNLQALTQFQNSTPFPPFQNSTNFPPSPPLSYPFQYSPTSSPSSPTGVRNVQILDPLNDEDSE